MKVREFKRFIQRVAVANQYDPIWWSGHLWNDLNDRQAVEMIRLLRVHPSIVKDGTAYRLPSGIHING